MASGPNESTVRSLLDLVSRHNNRLLDQQALARARIQLEAEQELLHGNRLLFPTQRQLQQQQQQVVNEAFRQTQVNGAHLDELARLQESQYLQQIPQHYGGNQPVMVYIPTTTFVQPPLPRAVSASQPPDILDLTIDDEEENEDERKREVDNNCFASPSKGRMVVSDNAARKRKSDKVSAEANIIIPRKLPVSHNTTIGARGTIPKSPPTERLLAPPPDYMPPKCVQTKDVSLLAKALLGQVDPAEAEEGSFLKGPLILTPSMLKVLAKRIKGQVKKNSRTTKDKEIAKLQCQLESAKKKAVAKADIEQIKKACTLEVEEIRRQSQRAMQAYMKATVNAFERLQQARNDTDD